MVTGRKRESGVNRGVDGERDGGGDRERKKTEKEEGTTR